MTVTLLEKVDIRDNGDKLGKSPEVLLPDDVETSMQEFFTGRILQTSSTLGTRSQRPHSAPGFKFPEIALRLNLICKYGFLWRQKIPWDGKHPITQKTVADMIERGQITFADIDTDEVIDF